MDGQDAGIRVVVFLWARPPVAVVMQMNRVLGIGASEIVRRVTAGDALVDAPGMVARAQAREILALIEPFAHEVHLVPTGGVPGPQTAVSDATLGEASVPMVEPPPFRPVPDADLAALVAQATERAIADLPATVHDRWCAVALVTTGEALRPYLCVTVHDADLWDLSASEFAVAGDEYFAALAPAWDAQGLLAEMDAENADRVFEIRLATLEEALRLLDVRSFFGVGEDRERVLLLVATMPPSLADVGFARRLNPPGPLRDRWFAEAAEGPVWPTRNIEVTRAPNPTMADLWRAVPGVLRGDGTCIYGPDEIDERNATFEVAQYAPGWVLVGGDSGGNGYLMRATGAEFDPAMGRSGGEVFLLDLGALTADVAGEGVFVTDDLLGWLRS